MLIYKGVDIPNAQIVQSKYGDKMIHIIWTRKGKFAEGEHEHDQKFCGRPSRPLMKYEDFECTIEEFEKIGCKQCQMKLEKIYNKVTAPKEEVIAEELLLENKVRVHGSDNWSSVTNLELINAWKNDRLRRDSKADGTIEKYTNIIEQLVIFTKKPVIDIGFNDIGDFLLLPTKRKKSTKQLNWYSISGFFEWVHYVGYLPKGNPCKTEEAEQFKLGGEKKDLNRALSQEEIDRIANYMKRMCKWHDYLGFSILVETGVRISEMTNLMVDQMRLVNYKDGEIFEIEFFCFKQQQRRPVPLSPELTKELKEYMANRNITDGYVIRNEYGKKLSTNHFNGVFDRVAKILNLDHFTPHSFRHTFGTTIYQKTRDIELVKEILGHTDIKTTDIYTHVTKAQQIDAMMTFAPRIHNHQE
jgi:integrase